MILRPVTRTAVKPVIRSVIDGGSGRSLEQQIAALFASGEQGAWYDPSDLSTLFQDAAGTTPVTALGQPVGLMLDKSKGLVRGPQRITNWDFSDGITGWSPGVTVTQSSVSAGVVTFSASVGGNAGSNRLAAPYGTLTPMRAYEVVLRARRVSGAGLLGIVTDSFGYRPLVGTDSSNFTEITTRWITPSGSDSRISLCPSVAYDVFEIDYLSVRELPGNHASQPTATARPTLQQDANGKYYLQFDGVDDYLSTSANIDFTATDKMTVVAGARREADDVRRRLVGLSSSYGNPGAFAIEAPGPALNGFMAAYAGAVTNMTAVASGAAPETAVVSFRADIGANTIRIRKNGVWGAENNGDVGGGNFGNYPIYVSSPGTFHKGNLYSLLIRGALSTQAQIEAAERYVNSKTGAY